MMRWWRCLAAGAILVAGRCACAADSPLAATLLDPDAVAREAAIHRIIADRAENQRPIVAAFTTGDLTMRVNALEVLKAWHAPVAELDPWRPETITPEKLGALARWAAASPSPAAAPATQPAVLSPDQQTQAATELRRLLASTGDAERAATRERLARLGPPLLPQLAPLLRDPALSDAQHRELVLLKYRLFTSDALLARWPSGPARITAPSAATRHAAALELANVATDADAPLLVRLFSDDDPLTRELSLRALTKIDGSEAGVALSRLLKDPELNVRAAVLKELAESPSARVIPAVIAYIRTEKDQDLICQAVRVLGAAKSADAVDCLVGLLDDSAWRVRAAAADALGELAGGDGVYVSGGKAAGGAGTRATVGLVKHLNDPDPFVLSRVMAVLEKGNPSVTAIGPLVALTHTHPEMTADVVKILTSDDSFVVTAYPEIKTFATNPDPAIRAQVIATLGSVMGLGAQALILKAMSDPDANVRIAAARVFCGQLLKVLPENGHVMVGGSWFSAAHSEPVDAAKWIADFHKGMHRPQWLDEVKPAVEAMAASNARAERLAVASLVLALGESDRTWPDLASVSPRDKDSLESIAQCLPWLTPAKRKTLLALLTPLADESGNQRELLETLGRLPDDNYLAAIWDFVARDADLQMVDAAREALNGYYFGTQWYNAAPGVPLTPEAQKLVRDLLVKARTGNDPQRLLAMVMLGNTSVKDAGAVAKEVLDNPALSEALRADAFHLLLLASKRSDAATLALEGLRQPARQAIALHYLADGLDAMTSFRGDLYVMNIAFLSSDDGEDSWSATPHTPRPPPGLTVEMLAPLRNSTDTDVRTYALYFLCLLKDHSALPPLEAALNAEDSQYSPTVRLLYRAITAFNDDSLTPKLEKIYARFDKNDSSIREFYWTIQTIKGPRILKLRQKIRDEYGVQRLQ